MLELISLIMILMILWSAVQYILYLLDTE